MKTFILWLLIGGAATVALLIFLQSNVDVPEAQMLNFRVGSATLAFAAAIPFARSLRRTA